MFGTHGTNGSLVDHGDTHEVRLAHETRLLSCASARFGFAPTLTSGSLMRHGTLGPYDSLVNGGTLSPSGSLSNVGTLTSPGSLP